MTQPLRILTFCYEWPPVGGGGGRAARDIAESLAKRGNAVRVQTVRFGRSPAHEVVNKVDLYRSWSFRRRADQCSPAEMAGYIVSNFFPGLKHVSTFKPDLIHAHFAVPTGALAFPIALMGKVPYFVTAHLGDVPGAIPDQTDHLFRRLSPLIRPIWNRAAALVAVSNFVANLARQAYGKELTIIPNGINLVGRPKAPGQSIGPTRLIFVGRLNPQKNLLFLAKVLSGIRDLHWECDIVGDGEERACLVEAFREAHVSERVRFHGWLDPGEVENKLRAAEIFLLPSKVEGLSVAALEASKFGLVLIGSDIPSLRESIVAGKNGYLLPTADSELWSDTIRELLNKPEKRLEMRRQSWEHAREFDLERIGERYERLFREVLSRIARAS